MCFLRTEMCVSLVFLEKKDLQASLYIALELVMMCVWECMGLLIKLSIAVDKDIDPQAVTIRDYLQ